MGSISSHIAITTPHPIKIPFFSPPPPNQLPDLAIIPLPFGVPTGVGPALFGMIPSSPSIPDVFR